MDFRHLIVTCLFSKLRLPFDNQKVKENYTIFLKKRPVFCLRTPGLSAAKYLSGVNYARPLRKLNC